MPEFMEREIRENDYVLIICTPNYRRKSETRTGGLGYEGHIMTAEIYAKNNHRKFIPILARGTWKDAAPSWLKGKYYIDLSSRDRFEENYQDLITTLRGERPSAPPLQRTTHSKSETQYEGTTNNDPIRIVGVIVDEVPEPTMDSTSGSALYTVPFRLSRQPSTLWSEIFAGTWDAPPIFSMMHRPGNARVFGSKIILDGTTIEEVKQYHRKTLILCVDKANEEEARILELRRRKAEQQRQKSEKHRANVEGIAGELDFE